MVKEEKESENGESGKKEKRERQTKNKKFFLLSPFGFLPFSFLFILECVHIYDVSVGIAKSKYVLGKEQPSKRGRDRAVHST